MTKVTKTVVEESEEEVDEEAVVDPQPEQPREIIENVSIVERTEVVQGEVITESIDEDLLKTDSDEDTSQVALIMIIILLGLLAIGVIIAVIIINRRRH